MLIEPLQSCNKRGMLILPVFLVKLMILQIPPE